MTTRIIDLSVTLEDQIKSEEVPPKIKYIDHKKGGLLLGLGLAWKGGNLIFKLFNLIRLILRRHLVTRREFPNGLGLSTEIITLASHAGTHVDSPYHYGPNLPTIEEISLDNFYGDGVILDFSTRSTGNAIAAEEIKAKLTEINYKLNPGDIVLIRTGADKFWGKEEYTTHFFGLSKDALLFLLDKDIKLIGIDAFGLDQPFLTMYQNYIKYNKNKAYLWPVHFEGRVNPYCMIEKLSNLDKIGRTSGFKVAAFPIKLKKASAAWARVVAIIED